MNRDEDLPECEGMVGNYNEIQETIQTRCALRSRKSVEYTLAVEVVVGMVDR